MVSNEADMGLTTDPRVFDAVQKSPGDLIITKMAAEEPATAPVIKLDLGCGSRTSEGFTGVDISPSCGATVVHDLRVTPWPWDDQTVDEVHCSHFFEHLSGYERISFMEELWRVMKPGAKALFITPDCDSHRAIQDPTHAWPPVCAESYLYFNKAWMTANKLEHYGINADFDFGYGFSLDPDVSLRSNEFRDFATKHYRNHSTDLHVTLTRK